MVQMMMELSAFTLIFLGTTPVMIQNHALMKNADASREKNAFVMKEPVKIEI